MLKGRLRLPMQAAEQVQGDDRDDRYAEQPKKNVAPHSVSLCVYSTPKRCIRTIALIGTPRSQRMTLRPIFNSRVSD